MEKVISFIKKPYIEKGFLIGTLDLLLKAGTLSVWLYLVYILGSLMIHSLVVDYNPLNTLWWFSYCFSMFFGATWLAYIVFFVRDYNND